MSYGISISRGNRYDDKAFRKITIEEWEKFVSDTNCYEVVNDAIGRNPKTGETITIKLNNTVKHKEKEFHLSWEEGVIVTMFFEELIADFTKVADYFGASLYGEEGEKY